VRGGSNAARSGPLGLTWASWAALLSALELAFTTLLARFRVPATASEGAVLELVGGVVALLIFCAVGDTRRTPSAAAWPGCWASRRLGARRQLPVFSRCSGSSGPTAVAATVEPVGGALLA